MQAPSEYGGHFFASMAAAGFESRCGLAQILAFLQQVLNAFYGMFKIEILQNRYCIRFLQIGQRPRCVLDHLSEKHRAFLLSGIVDKKARPSTAGQSLGGISWVLMKPGRSISDGLNWRLKLINSSNAGTAAILNSLPTLVSANSVQNGSLRSSGG